MIHCENTGNIVFSCPVGSVIEIFNANFGRTSNVHCRKCSAESAWSNTDCFGRGAQQVVRAA